MKTHNKSSSAHDENMEWYFAYASNLNIFQMMKRVGEWSTSKRAQLRGWKLGFVVPAHEKWGGYGATIKRTDNPPDIVHGAIYLLQKKKIPVLSTYEGIEPEPIEVEVEGETKPLKALVYVWRKENEPGPPSQVYSNTILEGLEHHGYSDSMIREVGSSIPKPN
jgi:hypothetical protein